MTTACLCEVDRPGLVVALAIRGVVFSEPAAPRSSPFVRRRAARSSRRCSSAIPTGSICVGHGAAHCCCRSRAVIRRRTPTRSTPGPGRRCGRDRSGDPLISALVRRRHAPSGSVRSKSLRSCAGHGAMASVSTCWRANMRCCSRWVEAKGAVPGRAVLHDRLFGRSSRLEPTLSTWTCPACAKLDRGFAAPLIVTARAWLSHGR